jgi:hypothetical protein
MTLARAEEDPLRSRDDLDRLLGGGGGELPWEQWRRGLVNGTDPAHPEF